MRGETARGTLACQVSLNDITSRPQCLDRELFDDRQQEPGATNQADGFGRFPPPTDVAKHRSKAEQRQWLIGICDEYIAGPLLFSFPIAVGREEDHLSAPGAHIIGIELARSIDGALGSST